MGKEKASQRGERDAEVGLRVLAQVKLKLTKYCRHEIRPGAEQRPKQLCNVKRGIRESIYGCFSEFKFCCFIVDELTLIDE